ncbi:transposase domain-containing protein [Sorangium sp. So ce590]
MRHGRASKQAGLPACRRPSRRRRRARLGGAHGRPPEPARHRPGATGSAPRSAGRHGQNDRVVALGRKNYLFAGSDEGAKRLAVGYTSFGSCRMHGTNPLAWATDVIGKLQAGWPRERLDELLPAAWARASLASPAAGDADAS